MPGVRLLSKSQYQKGRQCLRRIWLYRNKPDLAEKPSLVQQGIFEQGHEVGILAQKLFPNGVLISEDHKNPDGALASTDNAIRAGATAIYEAAFLYDGILVRADIIAKNSDGSWSLFEVKSTTSAKKEHLPDVSVQTHVIRSAGLPLTKSHLIHLNNEYVRRGEIDLTKLFTVAHLDDEIGEALAEIPAYLKSIRSALASNNEPTQNIGSVCKNPYVCEFQGHCWTGVEDDSIHYLYRITDKKRAELIARAIERVRDVPDDIALTELQYVQVKSERDGAPIIDKPAIKKHLEKLVWPLWFLDFETVGFAIPKYDGTRSYQALPFQFSLHVQREPDGSLEHIEFLHTRDTNPCRALAETLCAAIGDQGNVVAYHASFENGRVKELAEAYPDLAPKLESMITRMWDLETPFAKKHYYHSKFQGSSSIKKVLPVLVPSLSYDGLEIGKGDLAQMKYGEMIALADGDPEKEKIRLALLKYCGLDSLAMVKLLDVLRQL